MGTQDLERQSRPKDPQLAPVSLARVLSHRLELFFQILLILLERKKEINNLCEIERDACDDPKMKCKRTIHSNLSLGFFKFQTLILYNLNFFVSWIRLQTSGSGRPPLSSTSTTVT